MAFAWIYRHSFPFGVGACGLCTFVRFLAHGLGLRLLLRENNVESLRQQWGSVGGSTPKACLNAAQFVSQASI
jgi:hypothetical protein